MNDQTIIDLGSRAVIVTMQVAAPVLLAALVTGILVSIFQAATQINEPTLSFVPKIIMITIAMVVCGPWVLQVMMNYTSDMFTAIPGVTH